MFFLSNTAYPEAPGGALTDWSIVTKLSSRKRKQATDEMDSLCIYPTVFTNQLSALFCISRLFLF